MSTKLCKYFKLDHDWDLKRFFPVDKYNRKEVTRVRTHRLVHYLQKGIWINHSTLYNYLAENHGDDALSKTLQNHAVYRKIRRYEHGMMVPKDTFLTSCEMRVKFLWEYVRSPLTVGAIQPSSKNLAREIVSQIPKEMEAPKRLILEVGPGSGIFTDKIIQRMNPQDELHLVEFDKEFADKLRAKYRKAKNVRVFHISIQDFRNPNGRKYDYVISGLPLNNFASSDVRDILSKFKDLTKVKGKLSYFEYLFFADLGETFSPLQVNRDIVEIKRMKNEFYRTHPDKVVKVYQNLFPAKVLHHQIRSTIPA